MTAKLSTNRVMISHPGTKGDTLELNWIEFLKTYLPKRYSVDKGFAIDCEGNLSHQLDLLIFDKQYTPFVFSQDNVFYVPAESIYAVFEVKQELNKKYIEYAGEKVESVRRLKRTSAPVFHVDGCSDPKPHSRILGGILALSSPPLGNILEKSLRNLSDERKINIGCALQSGAFYVDDSKGDIHKSLPEESLIFFFLNLFRILQKLGTTPAIDIESYSANLTSK